MAALWKSWHWYECSHFELQPNWFHQQSWLNFNVFFNIYSRAFIKRMKKKWMFDVVFSKQNERTALRQTYKYYVYVESMVIPLSSPLAANPSTRAFRPKHNLYRKQSVFLCWQAEWITSITVYKKHIRLRWKGCKLLQKVPLLTSLVIPS